jgi:hypothetical protein
LFALEQDHHSLNFGPGLYQVGICSPHLHYELENTGVYTAYAVTLAMEKSLEEKETLSQDAIIGTSDVGLEDIFVWLMSTITVYIAMGICIVIL